MDTEPKDYTDFQVIAEAVKAGMAPFRPQDSNIIVYRTDLGKYRIKVAMKNLPKTATYDVDHVQLARADAGETLQILGQEFFKFFRNSRIEPEDNIELGDY